MQWPKPGWFSDVSDRHHPSARLRRAVEGPGNDVRRQDGQRGAGAAALNWTVAPRWLEIGYRLCRASASSPSPTAVFYTNGDGDVQRSGRQLQPHQPSGRELHRHGLRQPRVHSLGERSMKWRGRRSSRLHLAGYHRQPAACHMASAGTGVYADRAVNYTAGAGPHFGILLDHNFSPARALVHHQFRHRRHVHPHSPAVLHGDHHPDSLRPTRQGRIRRNFWNEVPILNYRIGLGWQPPSVPTFTSTPATSMSSGGRSEPRATRTGRTCSSITRA